VDRPDVAHPFALADGLPGGPRAAGVARALALARAIASYAALALDNALLAEQTRRRADQLASLYSLGRALSASLPVEALLASCAEFAARLVAADWCTLVLLEEHAGTQAGRWSATPDFPAELAHA